ncbi:WD repeat-containing protein 46-like isoform X2 [Gigantopelta aegis]|uniref:WD repeat-containing protein 46-like isoform X2 n=1 Tax=Gigantopelta aegis TaxID=1735272 RepID=UPI001B88B810|nr:WD repeat-containing protein 46-like isoform X2 [Gigantopelta aegis]
MDTDKKEPKRKRPVIPPGSTYFEATSRVSGKDKSFKNKRKPQGNGKQPKYRHGFKTFQKDKHGGQKTNSREKHMASKKPWHAHTVKKTLPRRRYDPFPGDAPVPDDKMKKYRRGSPMRNKTARSISGHYSFIEKEQKVKYAVKLSARSELLLQEDAGFLQAEEGENTAEISQFDIVDAVDITSAQKYFELKLPTFGPYRMNYTRNGRHLLIGGSKGHMAAIDWQTKKLLCEMNVMETVQDIKWLHQETMFAVAQKQWTYIYDNQGIELHCLRMLDSVLRMEFLPYHFLLATSNSKGFLSYIDISVGKAVAGHRTKLGRLDVMCKNPSNAVIHLGHSRGTVTLWSPNVKEPLVKMLCHGTGVRSVAVDKRGLYMATSGVDRKLKIWDLRTYKMLQSYKLAAGATTLAFSQRNMLAAGIGNIVQIYDDCCLNTASAPYMCHKLQSSVYGTEFCPYEDVLGVSHGNGFTSLLVPGSGEANFDALEENPFQTKKQRRNAEVKMLLDKIQPEMIHLDTTKIGQVDMKSFTQKVEEKNKLLFMKPQKAEYEPKYKKKGRSKASKVEKRKQGVQVQHKRDFIRKSIQLKQKEAQLNKQNENSGLAKTSVLDRFARKDS